MLLRDHSCHLVKRSGVAFSKEEGNLGGLHNYKYSSSQARAVKVIDNGNGVEISRRNKTGSSNKVRGAWSSASVKKSSAGCNRVRGVARDMESTGYRLDLVKPTQARLCALLRAGKARKEYTRKSRHANKQ